MSDYDVIGSGARGGTLTHRLAPSGKRILLLERGGWLPREPQNWRAEGVFVDNRYVSDDTWNYSDGSSFHPEVHYFVGARPDRHRSVCGRADRMRPPIAQDRGLQAFRGWRDPGLEPGTPRFSVGDDSDFDWRDLQGLS